MKNKIIRLSLIFIGIILITIIVISLVNGKNNKEEFQFSQVEKGDIKITVSSTGTIEAQKTVEVGTQVSGTISKLYANFNDKVRKNQVLALLDTKLLEIAVQTAEADLLKASAQYQLSLQDYENNVELNKSKLISDFDLEKLRVAKDAAYASELSTKASLMRAKTNFDYAIIRSPIDGTIIEKSVEEGQTVAASLSAPTLFSIAEDLSNIQIEALVTESDIGQIKENQKVNFTVEAYDNEQFTGTVEEIHLKPTVQSNVVNYVVIVKAKNKDNLLLPGMTATIDFILQEKNDVFLVPNAVLRFKPTDAMLKEVKSTMNDNNRQLNPEQGRNRNGQNQSNRQRNLSSNVTPDILNQNNEKPKNTAQLWYLDNNKKLNFIRVQTGITDGQKTELESDKIDLNMKFISGYDNSKKDNKATTNFQMRRIF